MAFRRRVRFSFPATGTPQNDILSLSLFLASSGHAARGDSGKSARLSRSAIQTLDESERWIPAFAGMTTFRVRGPGIVIPAQAGIHFHGLNRSFSHFPRQALRKKTPTSASGERNVRRANGFSEPITLGPHASQDVPKYGSSPEQNGAQRKGHGHPHSGEDDEL